jgi:hypothetical protein
MAHASSSDNLVFLGKSSDENVLDLAVALLGEIQERALGYKIVVQSLFLQIVVYLLRHCLELSARQNPPQTPSSIAFLANQPDF